MVQAGDLPAIRAERFDYSYLAQPRLEPTRGSGERRTAGSLLAEALEEGAFGAPLLRGGAPVRAERAMMKVFTWEVVSESVGRGRP
jgi:hypothetical protein